MTKESIDRVIHEVRAVREVLGPDVTIMGDAFMGLDVDSTLRLADELSDVGLSWIEEPLLPDDLEGYARLRDECPIPIAGGVRVLQSFQRVVPFVGVASTRHRSEGFVEWVNARHGQCLNKPARDV